MYLYPYIYIYIYIYICVHLHFNVLIYNLLTKYVINTRIMCIYSISGEYYLNFGLKVLNLVGYI